MTTVLTNAQYLEKYANTNKDKTSFERHLEVCGLKTKMDKVRRTKKFLWGVKTITNDVVWTPLYDLNKNHLIYIKNYLLNYPHGFDDEDIGVVIDLIEVAIQNT